MKDLFDNRQAVSESLGYILIFAVVVGCIAIMYVVGSQIIDSNQASTSFQSMVQNFNVIRSNLMATASGSSPVMTTTLNVQHGSLALLPPADSDNLIVVKFSSYPDICIPIGRLEYTSQSSQRIALEDGAIITAYDWDTQADSIVTQEPRLFYSNTTGTLMFCTVNLKGTRSSISSSFVTLKLKSRGLPSPYDYLADDQSDGESVEVCVKTLYTNAWKDYLCNIPGMQGDVDMASPPEWANVTLSDKHNHLNGVKKLTIVNYEVDATLG